MGMHCTYSFFSLATYKFWSCHDPPFEFAMEFNFTYDYQLVIKDTTQEHQMAEIHIYCKVQGKGGTSFMPSLWVPLFWHLHVST
jgi:hypothetical protein